MISGIVLITHQLRRKLMNPEITSEVKKQIADHLFDGRKINAIKLIRRESGMGLKEAKEFVDGIEGELREKYPDKFVNKAGSGCGTAAVIFIVLTIAAGYGAVLLV